MSTVQGSTLASRCLLRGLDGLLVYLKYLYSYMGLKYIFWS